MLHEEIYIWKACVWVCLCVSVMGRGEERVGWTQRNRYQVGEHLLRTIGRTEGGWVKFKLYCFIIANFSETFAGLKHQIWTGVRCFHRHKAALLRKGAFTESAIALIFYWYATLKGIVHPKIETLSSFSQPHVVSDPSMGGSSSLGTFMSQGLIFFLKLSIMIHYLYLLNSKHIYE